MAQLLKINNQKFVKKNILPKILFSTAVVLLMLWIFMKTDPNFENSHLFSTIFKDIFNFSPIQVGAFNKITITDTLIKVLMTMGDTFAFSILGTLLGVIISIPLSFLSSKQITKKVFIWWPVKTIMSIVRSIPPIVYACLFFYLLSPSLAAVLSLAVFVSSLMVKWMAEELDSIDLGSYDMLISFGNKKYNAIFAAVFPIFINKLVSYSLYAFEMVVRFATILAFVGIPTIGIMFMDPYDNPSVWGHMVLSLIIMIIIIILIELLTILINKKILNKQFNHIEVEGVSVEEKINSAISKKPKNTRRNLIIGLSSLSIFIFSMTKMKFEINSGAKLELFNNGIRKLFNPDWSYLVDFGTGANAVELGLTVVWIAIASTIIGTLAGTFIGILASKNITGKPIAWIFKIFIIITRTIPSFVYAIVFVICIAHASDFAAVMALALRSIGMLGKLTYEKIESIDPGAKLSMDVSGNNTFNSTRIAIISEALPTIVSNSLYRVEINFKTITDVGAVGASAFGFQLMIYSKDTTQWDKLVPYVIVMVAFVLIIEQISNILRKKVTEGHFVSQSNFIKRAWTNFVSNRNLFVAMATNEKIEHTEMARKYDFINLKSKLNSKEKLRLAKIQYKRMFNENFRKNIREIEESINSLIDATSKETCEVVIKENNEVISKMRRNMKKVASVKARNKIMYSYSKI